MREIYLISRNSYLINNYYVVNNIFEKEFLRRKSLILQPVSGAGLAKSENILTGFADMAKLADAPDLGSGGAIHVGSTPIIRTAEVDKLTS